MTPSRQFSNGEVCRLNRLTKRLLSAKNRVGSPLSVDQLFEMGPRCPGEQSASCSYRNRFPFEWLAFSISCHEKRSLPIIFCTVIAKFFDTVTFLDSDIEYDSEEQMIEMFTSAEKAL